MKIIFVPDVHGRNHWKEFPLNEFDLVVFGGDYVDSFDLKDEEIIRNLQDILQYKRDNPDKCILLIGNHDLQYIYSYESNGCSGFRYSYYHTLHHIFRSDMELFQAAYQKGDYLFTHAGVSSVWWNKFWRNMQEWYDDEPEISKVINDGFKENIIDLYDVGYCRGGWCKSGGPFWADKSETMAYMLPGYHQVVGHTPVKEITTHEAGDSSITYCDTIHYYYEIEI